MANLNIASRLSNHFEDNLSKRHPSDDDTVVRSPLALFHPNGDQHVRIPSEECPRDIPTLDHMINTYLREPGEERPKFLMDANGVTLHITKGDLHCTIVQEVLDWHSPHAILASAVELTCAVDWITEADVLSYMLQQVIGRSSEELSEDPEDVDELSARGEGEMSMDDWKVGEPYIFLT